MNMSNIIHKFADFLDGSTQQLPSAHTNICEILHRADGARDSVLVIDASGSMYRTDWKPSRVKAAQEAAKAFVERLASEEPDACVAVVAYGDSAMLLSDLTAARKCNELAQSIDSISSMGSTNITAGLEIALRLLQANQGLGQVVLLTDGCHNTGRGPKGISDRLRERAIVECVGIGGKPKNVDEKLLRYIASPYPNGSKRYRWIGDKEGLVQHFHNLAGRIVRA